MSSISDNRDILQRQNMKQIQFVDPELLDDVVLRRRRDGTWRDEKSFRSSLFSIFVADGLSTGFGDSSCDMYSV